MDTNTIQQLDEALGRVSFKRTGRPWTVYTDTAGDEWIISEGNNVTRGIWQFQHTDTETEPDGEGGMQPTDNRHGIADGLLDCIATIEEQFAAEKVAA